VQVGYEKQSHDRSGFELGGEDFCLASLIETDKLGGA
jgi:hypothetical protein